MRLPLGLQVVAVAAGEEVACLLSALALVIVAAKGAATTLSTYSAMSMAFTRTSRERRCDDHSWA